MASNSLGSRLIRSPKLTSRAEDRWYRYYAGFNPEFVSDIIDVLDLNEDSAVLDPWMGSGTTLSVAAARGLGVSGVDLNPAMIAVAKGRLVADDTESSLAPLEREIEARWTSSPVTSADPLSQWFDAPSTARIRGCARAIDTLLIDELAPGSSKVEAMSSLAAFFYVALFEAVGQSMKEYSSRNPTWVKSAKLGAGQAQVSDFDIRRRFRTAAARLSKYLSSSTPINVRTRDRAVISRGDSRILGSISDSTIDATISSPPYLTRLDYVIGHLPELAVLGIGGDEVKVLRDQMIGTPTMGSSPQDVPIGIHAEMLLQSVRNHGSYAAKSYYEPNFRRYFEGISQSFAEIDRVSKREAAVVLVVQDSWFKGIHVDLGQCVSSIAAQYGWRLAGEKGFTSVRSMAQVNTRASRESRTNRPIESVLHFSN